jgi:hypothetical protein
VTRAAQRLIVDAGPLIGWLDANDAYHAMVRGSFDGYTGELLSTGPVLGRVAGRERGSHQSAEAATRVEPMSLQGSFRHEALGGAGRHSRQPHQHRSRDGLAGITVTPPAY